MQVALVLALLLAAAPAGAQMYKCKDEGGVTRYSDKPCAPGQGGQVSIKPIPSLSGKDAASPAVDYRSQDADFRRRQVERAEAEARGKAEMDKRCSQLRREQAWLSGGTRASRVVDGKRVFVEDAARDARLKELAEALRSCP